MTHPLAITGASYGDSFRHAGDFTPGEVSGGLGLGPLELQYEELFAEVLEDGIITVEERGRLDKVADNLGLDRTRLRRLEEAMVAAYQARHRVRVVERFAEPPASLTPLEDAAPTSKTDPHVLLAEVTRLRARVAELEEELRRARAAVNVEVDLGDLETAVEASAEDPDEHWKRVRRDPTDTAALRELYRIYRAREDADAAWCVAQALATLGEAQGEEQAHFEAHRRQGLIAPRTSITAAAWQDCLFHQEEDQLTSQIFSLIAPAVLIGRVTTLRRDGLLAQPVPESRQDPASSTLMAVRAVGWAAALLGLGAPRVHIEKDQNAGYRHVPGVPPFTIVGGGALRGRSETELAFLVGRHLSGYRGEHFVKTLYTAVHDLEDLFLAALVIAQPSLPLAGGVKTRIEPTARAIAPLLEGPQLDALRGHFLRFIEEGGRTNLQRWAAAVDKTQARVGLALSQDLASATRVLEAEEGPRGPLARDLIAFSTSSRFMRLRKQLGIAIGS
jgi:hypothetical protein